MKTKSIKRNYIYNLLYQVLSILTPLITTPYISRVIQADGIGVYSFASSIVAYFMLFATMGTTTYGKRAISYTQENVEDRSYIFWNVVSFRLISTIFICVCYVGFVYISRLDKGIYLIFLLNIISVVFDISWFFQGMEEFKKITIRDAIFKLIGIICIFMFVKSKDDLPIYVLLMCSITFFSAISFWSIISKYIIKIPFLQLSPFYNWRVILSLFIPTIAIQIYCVLDKTMIGLITGSSFENGYYEQALKISQLVLALITALGTVMIPRIGSLFAQQKYDEIRNYMYKGYCFVWFTGTPICLGLVGISENFVPWFFGDGYEPVSILVKILAFLVLAIGINNVTGMQYLIPTGKERIFTVSVIMGAIINFTLNMVLIPLCGCVGAAIASVFAETMIAIIQLIYIRSEISGWRVLKIGWKYIISGLIMLCLLCFENKLLDASILHTSIMIVTGGVLYIALLIILRDVFFLTYIRQVLQVVKGRNLDV